MGSEAIRTRTGSTWMDEELGVVRFVYAQGVECSLEDAKENIDAQIRAAGGRVMPILVDITQCKSVSKEARVHYANTKAFGALALVGGSPIGNAIGNMFLAVYARGAPTKLFTSERAAIEWLHEFTR